MIVKFMADKLIITFDEYNKIVEKLVPSFGLGLAAYCALLAPTSVTDAPVLPTLQTSTLLITSGLGQGLAPRLR